MNEFDFIRDHLSPLSAEGLRDDAARLRDIKQGWTVSTDTSVEGVHFPSGMRGASAADRAVRTALSDLAAKAATPVGYMLNLVLPRDMDGRWLVALAQGFGDVQGAFKIDLLGGDTVRHLGELIIGVTVFGEGRGPSRSGAQPGDDVWVSGPIGDGYLGMKFVTDQPPLTEPTGADLMLWEEAYLRPEPRFDLRQVILSVATASLDVSDGLVADVGHIARASEVGIELRAEDVPLSPTSRRWANGEIQKLFALMTGGDDYEIAFTAKPDDREAILAAECTRIGRVIPGDGVRVLADGKPVQIAEPGWEH